PRFAFVHIASMPSSNQINSMESQTIHIIQLLCGPTLRDIAAKIKCDIQTAVKNVIWQDKLAAKYNNGIRNAIWFENWGVQYTIDLYVEELSSLNPTAVWAPPSPSNTLFTIGGGLTASSAASRKITMSFFYMVNELAQMPPCIPPEFKISDIQSLLILDDLKISHPLLSYIFSIGTGAGNAPISTTHPLAKSALTDRVRFTVVTGGQVNPIWRLERLDIGTGGGLFRTSRDRTHELSITYGPADPKTGSLVGAASTQFLAKQISSARDR
ncbi:hypothetical protein VQ045_21605, partial [Aurantimonas sp. E1-2-R+4]|uniref:hypothetical protein n=1 Tax=Aurantimonas sp. E1-2-R+4 TaxID=3113714 RepID=UPI002F955D71